MGEIASLQDILATQTVWRSARPIIRQVDGEPTGHAALDALLPQGGWPQHAITELLLPADGVGELSLLLPTLARLSQRAQAITVIAPPFVPYAPAWQAAGVALTHLHVVQARADEAAWAFEQCLRSGACGAVLGWITQSDATVLRRLQLAADGGRSLGFVLRPARCAANPSPAPLRLEALPDVQGQSHWLVRKCRGGPTPAQSFHLARA